MKMDLHDTIRVPFSHRVSYLYLPALFVVTSVLMEVFMFMIMGVAFPRAYIFSFCILLFIAALIALCRKKWLQTVICSLLLGWQLITTISNVIANETCMEIFSLETLKTFGMAFTNAGAARLSLWFLVPYILLILLYVGGVVAIMWFFRAPQVKHHFGHVLLCGLLVVMSFFSYTVAYSGLPNYQIGADTYVTNLHNAKFLYDTCTNRVSSLRTFGSYSYYLDNLLQIMGGKREVTDVLNVKVTDEFQANDFALNHDEVLGEGYNLIMVLMETFERAAINPVTMPNLYQFMQESCVEVDGYYSIERTCFTDHISQTGMHAAGKEVWNNFGHVTVPHSLANIFNRSEGYQTAAFHDYDASSYHRGDIFTKRFGFQNFYDYNTYPNAHRTAHCGLNSDAELFANNLARIAPTDKNFYSYIVSVSTHAMSASWCNLEKYYPEIFAYMEQPENWEVLKQLYPILVNGTPYQVLTAKNYLAGTYIFDQGFGALLNYLKTTPGKDGKLLIETTALVMFGDHYYYVTPSALKPENDNPRDLLGNRCPLIVYNPKAKTPDGTITQAENAKKEHPAACGSTLRRFTSTMDIYPTACSLFGIQTDQQLTYGHSIFDPNDSLGVGYLGGYTWGATGYSGLDEETFTYHGIDYKIDKANWQLWRTLDFVNFAGTSLNAEQIAAVTPLVNRTYASIYLDTWLYQKDGFKKLAKSAQYHCASAA